MAKKDVITLYGDKYPCFNVSFPVGPGKYNDIGDVMLIQAMFNFVAIGDGLERLGDISKDDLPRLTAVFDDKTKKLIGAFQRKWARLLLAVDGVIFPADYRNRNLQTLGGVSGPARRLTITLLHEFASTAGARMNEVDYTEAMMEMFPALLQFVDVRPFRLQTAGA